MTLQPNDALVGTLAELTAPGATSPKGTVPAPVPSLNHGSRPAPAPASAA